MKYRKILTALLLLGATLTAGAQNDEPAATGNPHTTVAEPRQLPLVTTKIHLVTRTYGDSIVLRWVPEDYVSWKYLCDYGVNILREDKSRSDFHVDTVAYRLKPLTQADFEARYPKSDSLALVAMGVLYGEGRLGYAQTKEAPGTMGANLEYNNEQDISFGFAMVVAEWRRDLAEAMAVGITDHNVQPGGVYTYYVQPTQWENGGQLIFEPGVAERVKNDPYRPTPFRPVMTDTLSSPRQHVLGWWDAQFTSYEVERRAVSQLDGTPIDGEWERVNDKPYVPMMELPEGEGYRLLADSVPHFGVYEYRVMAHEPFATLTAPSPAFRVVVNDNEPPRAAQLMRIIIERPVEGDPMAQINAHFFWEKDTLEADLRGYLIDFNNATETGGEWRLLTDDFLAPTDTTCVIDVTGLRTGFARITAYDMAGNSAHSLEQLLHVTDFRPPLPPDSLQAEVLPEGYVLLRWKQPEVDDDIQYWDVAYANDSTHVFQLRNQGGIPEEMFVDTLALDVNQKWIYYKVRAVDYSGHFGPYSRWIRVLRPHDSPPTTPHLDTSTHNDRDGMHMRWIVGTDADMTYHELFRQVGDELPVLMARLDADSLSQHGYAFEVNDNPPYEREHRYAYYVVSHNSTPYTSTSLAVNFLHKGPKVYSVSLRMRGDYDARTKQARLVWDTGRLPFDAPFYYCIYRKLAGEKDFTYQMNTPSDTPEYTDHFPSDADSAEYYVMIQWRDGRQSTQSNKVTVKRRGER